MSRLQTHTLESAPEKSKPILEDLKSKGKFLNIFKALANSPAALDGYLKFSGALGSGTLGNEAREGIALLLAQRNGCDYCMTAHTGLAKKFGFDDAAVASSRQGTGGKDERVGAAVRFAAAVLDAQGGAVSETDLNKAREAGLSDSDVVEILATIALNYFTNIFNNVNDTTVDLPNPIKVSAA
jgi:uncharacterized peroxidase-related enzyme